MNYVAIGSNLSGSDGETSLDICRRAIKNISSIPGVHVTGVSRWYKTAPQPPSGQPDYINGVIRLDLECGADWFLKQLQSIELQEGRVRSEINAARTLDLDIIAMGGLLREPGVDVPEEGDSVTDLTLPHPRAHQRAFVLMPLRDVAPDWIHPRLNMSIDDLIAALDPQPIAVIDESESDS